MPYPAKFDLPTEWTDTTFKLSWRVNCSINAPIINYNLEFKELPHGQWFVINIPAEIDFSHLHEKQKQIRSRKNAAGNDIVEFQQSYTIRGLTKGSSYKVHSRIRLKRQYDVVQLFRPRYEVETNLVSVLKLY